MEFDKSKIYTALNADELKVGSKVIVADNLSDLRAQVESLMCFAVAVTVILREIRPECYLHRFVGEDGNEHAFAYLISEPEEKKLKWTDLKFGDIIRKKYKDGYRSAMVIRIDTYSTVQHIGFGGEWLTDDELEEWEKVEAN